MTEREWTIPMGSQVSVAARAELERRRADCKAAGVPWCDEHNREQTWTPFGFKCESCCREAACCGDPGDCGSCGA